MNSHVHTNAAVGQAVKDDLVAVRMPDSFDTINDNENPKER